MRLVIALTVALSLCLAAFLIPVATSANSSTAVIATDQYLLVGQLPNQVASGDTTRNSTVLWARSSNPGPIVFFVSTEPSFTHPGLVHTSLPPGNWVVVATADIHSIGIRDVRSGGCELRNGSISIGRSGWGAFIFDEDDMFLSIPVSMNGGAALPEGGVISLWCSADTVERRRRPR